MSTERIEDMKIVLVHQMCDCGGEFIMVGKGIKGPAPRLAHKCSKCGDFHTFDREYPCIRYDKIGKTILVGDDS